MLEDLIMAAVNEAMRKVDEESVSAMSKLTGGLGGTGRRTSVLMEYYSSYISKLIEELGRLPGIGPKSAPETGVSHCQHAPGASGGSVRRHSGGKRACALLRHLLHPDGIMRSVPSAAILPGIRERLWWWKIPEIWQPMKKQERTTASIMFFTGPSPLCWASGRMT